MKHIICNRGGNYFPFVRRNDTFDSMITVKDKDGNNLRDILCVNTDFCNGYKGGILAEGDYWFVCGLRTSGAKVLYLADLKYKDEINKKDDLQESMRVLPSLIPNPNHDGKKIISQVLIHSDGYDGGWSHGCITIYPDSWSDFIKLFAIDETGLFTLDRDILWRPSDIYPIRGLS